jgi:formate dehydrogenase subunit gamma
LEPVYCLGLCASSPAIQINERVHARVSAGKLQRLLQETLEATP